MTDIVQRLRQNAVSKGDYRDEAANEIEKLRGAIKTLVMNCPDPVPLQDKLPGFFEAWLAAEKAIYE